MLNKHIRKIEPIIEELKGKRIEKVNGVLIPEYLYSFPNGLQLSFDLDKRDNYFDVKLGSWNYKNEYNSSFRELFVGKVGNKELFSNYCLNIVPTTAKRKSMEELIKTYNALYVNKLVTRFPPRRLAPICILLW